MRQVLFRIPIPQWMTEEVFVYPLGLLVLVLIFAVRTWLARRHPKEEDTSKTNLPKLAFWVVGIAFIVGVRYGLAFLRQWVPDGIPIFGFGAMLFLAFVTCTWLAGRRAEKEGIGQEHIQDLAIWLFIGGIIGARLTSLYVEKLPLWQFFRIWEGGLYVYGSAAGGLVGYGLAYLFVIRKLGLSTWKLAGIIAPYVAIGLCLGRVGCLLNGCCYGSVADCPYCQAVHYPLWSQPRYELVDKGFQTAAGFTIAKLEPATVGKVEAGSPAAKSGLESGDLIVQADDQEIKSYQDLNNYLVPADRSQGPKRKNQLTLTVERDHKRIELEPFAPRTLGLHPTQVYESISMALLFLLLTAYYPLRRHPGEVMALLMFCYGVHRILDEQLRADPRQEGLEAYVSLLLIVAGSVLWIWLRLRPLQPARTAAATA